MQAVTHDLVRLLALHVGDEADAAGVVLVARIIKTLFGRQSKGMRGGRLGLGASLTSVCSVSDGKRSAIFIPPSWPPWRSIPGASWSAPAGCGALHVPIHLSSGLARRCKASPGVPGARRGYVS
jgi:hypothetical protein